MPGSTPIAAGRRATGPNARTATATATVVLLACTGCTTAGGAAASGPGEDAPGSAGGPALTAARLEGALLPRVEGYTPFGRPESGEYAKLRAVQQGSQLQRAAELDKPECAEATQSFASDERVLRAPAASVAFAQASRLTIHQMLIALPADIAAEHVGYRVPKSCQTYRAQIDGRSFSYRVVEHGAGVIGGPVGDASRTVGVAVKARSGGGRQTKIWHVAFRGGGYLGFITLSGPLAGRAEAEELARRAFEQADRSLS